MAATTQAVELAQVAMKAAQDKLATEIVALDVSEQLYITDVFIVASGDSDRQVRAIVDEVEKELRSHDVKPLRREGLDEARWVLLDFGDIVVHIQHTEDREYYALERLWKDCPPVAVPVAQGE